jgi:hypothetical protein
MKCCIASYSSLTICRTDQLDPNKRLEILGRLPHVAYPVRKNFINLISYKGLDK